MKKILMLMLALCLLLSPALCEGAAEQFESEYFSLTLPAGLFTLGEGGRAGYEAAVESDFPQAGECLLAAVNADASAALTVHLVQSDQPALEAAKEAAEKILGSAETVKEHTFGEHESGSFACAVGELRFEVYYISTGEALLVIGASGVEAAAMEIMLEGISF